MDQQYILFEAQQEDRLYNIKESYHIYTITQLKDKTTVFTNIGNKPERLLETLEQKDEFFSKYKRNNINVPMFMTKGLADIIDDKGEYINNMVIGG